MFQSNGRKISFPEKNNLVYICKYQINSHQLVFCLLVITARLLGCIKNITYQLSYEIEKKQG